MKGSMTQKRFQLTTISRIALEAVVSSSDSSSICPCTDRFRSELELEKVEDPLRNAGVRYKQSAIAFDVMCTSALENTARESQQTAFV
jgi:hypothetical protein